MSGNTFNLVDTIQSYFTGEAVNRMSSVFGESAETTRSAVSAAIPGLLGALDRVASSRDGASRINSAIDAADDTTMDGSIGTIAKRLVSDSSIGMLRSVLGVDGFSQLGNMVGKTSGFSANAVTSLLGFITPIVFGVLKRVKRTTGAERFDIAGLLASQRANIAAAMPERIEEPYAAPIG